jgi:hypothetical protein
VNSTAVALDASIVFTFDEPVKPGQGSIVVRNVTANTSSSTSIVSFSPFTGWGTNQITFNPRRDFAPDSDYAIMLSSGAIVDFAGNPHAGITSTVFTFHTALASDELL